MPRCGKGRSAWWSHGSRGLPRLRPAGGRLRADPLPELPAEHLLACSSRIRNFCPRSRAKRSALFAERVVTDVLEPVPHRYVVLAIPRVLRRLFQRERRLLGLFARVVRAARDAIGPLRCVNGHEYAPLAGFAFCFQCGQPEK